MAEYEIPSMSELNQTPPAEPQPAWVEVGLLAAMQIGISLVMHLLGQEFKTNDTASGTGLFAMFIGAQMFASYHARKFPGRLTKLFIRRLTFRSGMIHTVLGVALFALLALGHNLPPELPPISPGALLVAIPLAALGIMLLTWCGIKLGMLMSGPLGPPARPAG